MGHLAQTIPINSLLRIVELCEIDRAKVARVREMQELLAAWIARVDWAHRFHHMIVTVYFVDESDSRFSVLVRARNDAVPNIRGEDHARQRWFFNSSFR